MSLVEMSTKVLFVGSTKTHTHANVPTRTNAPTHACAYTLIHTSHPFNFSAPPFCTQGVKDHSAKSVVLTIAPMKKYGLDKERKN